MIYPSLFKIILLIKYTLWKVPLNIIEYLEKKKRCSESLSWWTWVNCGVVDNRQLGTTMWYRWLELHHGDGCFIAGNKQTTGFIGHPVATSFVQFSSLSLVQVFRTPWTTEIRGFLCVVAMSVFVEKKHLDFERLIYQRLSRKLAPCCGSSSIFNDSQNWLRSPTLHFRCGDLSGGSLQFFPKNTGQ